MVERDLKFNAQREYLNFILQFPRATRPMPFCFYTFSYFFHKNPDFKKIKMKDKKFYSFQPMDLILYVNSSKKYFVGINLNQMSVQSRKLLLTKIKKDYPTKFDDKKIRLPGINFRKLFRYLRKIGIIIRKYLFERTHSLRFIPGDKIDTLMNFTSNFYYKTTYQWVAQRYLNYRPKT
jgi:hypothetical protein